MAYSNAVGWTFLQYMFPEAGFTVGNYLTIQVVMIVVAMDLYALLGMRKILLPVKALARIREQGENDAMVERQAILAVRKIPGFAATTVFIALLSNLHPVWMITAGTGLYATAMMMMEFYLCVNYVVFY